MPWKTAVAAADFFSVEVLTREASFATSCCSYRPQDETRSHAGVTCHADGRRRQRSLYTAHFRSLLETAGVHPLRLPAKSPNLNRYAERFVRSIKQECLRHVIPLGERHLRSVIRDFVDHYHTERNHQGPGNVIPFPAFVPHIGRNCRHARVGGLLNSYERKAA